MRITLPCSASTIAAAAILAFSLARPAVLMASGNAGSVPADVLARQAAEYRAESPKTVLELQQFRLVDSTSATGGGGRVGTASLINLNPRINAWFVLTLDWGSRGRVSYHLENPHPRTQTMDFGDQNFPGVRITADGRAISCDLWSGTTTALDQAQRSALPYAPLCDGRLYLRNRVKGNQTNLERVTDFLRDYVWGGETIIRAVRQGFYSDRFLEKGVAGAAAPAALDSETLHPDWPRAAALAVPPGERSTVPQDLGIDLGQPMSALAPGRWYPVNGLAGAFVSFAQPRLIDPQLLRGDRGIVNPLDDVETDALDYLVAFDLTQFEVGFTLGTDHPRVNWSERPPSNMRDPKLPGPDGIDTISPLVSNGMISPALAARTIATFTGGFKREHGAFRYGPLSERNHGTHYGFIEEGAVLSKLMPGLSTLYMLDNGSVDMKTWTEQDDVLLPRIRDARQNGVPLIEYDAATGVSAPGALVARWGPGNWSGSADEKLRTVRAGVCLQQTANRRFLIYGYFSSATPSAMARVFQAYHCRYAMHLDMNALEHTYLALYVHSGSEIRVEHLVQGMAQLDKPEDSKVVPRFLGFPDDRDFFYLTQKEAPQ
jgi:hypothetical protein